MIGLVSTVVTVDIPRRDRLFSGSICYRMRSCKSSSGVSSNAVEASKDSTVITICTGVPAGTTATLGALAPVLPGRSAAIRSGSQLGSRAINETDSRECQVRDSGFDGDRLRAFYPSKWAFSYSVPGPTHRNRIPAAMAIAS
jgi:hypothetical protein